MKLQNFMKGLGIGVIFTSIVLLVATSGSKKNPILDNEGIIERAKVLGMYTQDQYMNKTMTDDQITQKAKALGMVTQEEYTNKTMTKEQIVEEAKALGMVTQEEYTNKAMTKEQIVEKAKELGMVTKEEYLNKSIPKDQIIKNAKELGMIFKSSEVVELPEEKPANTNVTGDTAIIVVTKGMNSIEISKILKEVGVIENAEEFGKFLEKNNYDSILRIGTFHIEKGTSFDAIAKILMKSKN